MADIPKCPLFGDPTILYWHMQTTVQGVTEGLMLHTPADFTSLCIMDIMGYLMGKHSYGLHSHSRSLATASNTGLLVA